MLFLATCLPPACCGTRGGGGSFWERQVSQVTQRGVFAAILRRSPARLAPLSRGCDAIGVILTLQVQRRSDVDAISRGSNVTTVRQRLAYSARPRRQTGTGAGTAIRRRLRQLASLRKWRVGTASAVVRDSLISTAAAPATLPGLAVEIFDGGDSRMPIASTKVAVRTAVAPCLNYTQANTVKDGLNGALFKLAGKTLDFDLRFTGRCLALPDATILLGTSCKQPDSRL